VLPAGTTTRVSVGALWPPWLLPEPWLPWPELPGAIDTPLPLLGDPAYALSHAVGRTVTTMAAAEIASFRAVLRRRSLLEGNMLLRSGSGSGNRRPAAHPG
jgi:hypothetical protein